MINNVEHYSRYQKSIENTLNPIKLYPKESISVQRKCLYDVCLTLGHKEFPNLSNCEYVLEQVTHIASDIRLYDSFDAIEEQLLNGDFNGLTVAALVPFKHPISSRLQYNPALEHVSLDANLSDMILVGNSNCSHSEFNKLFFLPETIDALKFSPLKFEFKELHSECKSTAASLSALIASDGLNNACITSRRAYNHFTQELKGDSGDIHIIDTLLKSKKNSFGLFSKVLS